MVENLSTSVQNVKRPTLGIEERLQIIQQALVDLQAVGVPVRVSPLYGATGLYTTVIVLEGVDIVDGNLMHATTGRKESQ
jgi:hypothetical protein